MGTKESVELLLKHADFAWRSYSDRRAIEWKVNFGLWTALGVFAGFVFQLNTETLLMQIVYLASGILIFPMAVYIMWKFEIQKRNTRDLKAMYYYWEKANDELANLGDKLANLKCAPHFKKDKPNFDKPKFPWLRRTHLSQVLITLLFVILAIFAMWTRTIEMNIPSAEKVTVDEDKKRFTVNLSKNLTLPVPIENYEWLSNATTQERQNWRLIECGKKIYWEDIPGDISVKELLTGKD